MVTRGDGARSGAARHGGSWDGRDRRVESPGPTAVQVVTSRFRDRMKLPFASIRLRSWRSKTRTSNLRPPRREPPAEATLTSVPQVPGSTVPLPGNGAPAAAPTATDWSAPDIFPARIGRLPAAPPAADRLAPATIPGRDAKTVRAPMPRKSIRSGARARPSPDDEVAPRVRPGPPLITLRNVSRRYRGAVAVAALEGASLDIQAGEFVVVLGASGSGKTTLLNLIGALDQASEGEIVAGGRNLSTASRGELARYRRETVTFIFQTFNLFPALTALENVEFGASVARRGRTTAIASEMLARVGLGHRLRHFPHALSGGEQQRVAIARALAIGNAIVLADEPTGELDFRTGLQILHLLQDQAVAGRAVIVVTHNREIARVADRIVELSSGRIVSDRLVEGKRPALDDLHW